MSNIDHIIETVLEDTGIDITSVYCLATGRPFARLDAEEIDNLIETAPDGDWESLAEYLAMATLASCRTSPTWSQLSPARMTQMIKDRPAEAMAYLLIRLYEPANKLKVSFNQRLANYHQRIRIYDLVKRLFELRVDGDESMTQHIDDLLFMLVEIDAKYNLTSLPIPKNDLELTLLLAANITRVGVLRMIVAWKKWHKPLAKSYEDKLKAAIQQDQWLKGSTLVRPGYFNLWMEKKPVTLATHKKREQKKGDEFMAGIFDELEQAEPTPRVKPTVKVKPVQITTKAPIRFGVKKVEA